MGVKFGTSWGVALKIFKIWLLVWFFSKMVSNLSVLEGIFETKFQVQFFFSISCCYNCWRIWTLNPELWTLSPERGSCNNVGSLKQIFCKFETGGRGGAIIFRFSHRDRIWANFIYHNSVTCILCSPYYLRADAELMEKLAFVITSYTKQFAFFMLMTLGGGQATHNT